jgi:hypothetical protein
MCLIALHSACAGPKHHSKTCDWGPQSGRTPLMYACRSGNLDYVQALVTHGADIRIKDEVCKPVEHCNDG